MACCRMIAWDDIPSPNGISKPSMSGGKFETATTRRASRSRSHSGMSPLSAPRSVVASLTIDERTVSRSSDSATRRDQELVELVAQGVGREVGHRGFQSLRGHAATACAGRMIVARAAGALWLSTKVWRSVSAVGAIWPVAADCYVAGTSNVPGGV